MTANVYTGRASTKSFSDLLDREQPDVVLCQELGIDIAGVLSERYEHGTAIGDDHGYCGRALVSNFEIVVDELPMAHRPALVTMLPVGVVGVQLVGVHLANPVNGFGAISDRRKQVQSVLDHLDRVGAPAVVAGDMNATPMWPAYRKLRTRLRDGVRDAPDAGFPVRTWAPRPGMPGLLRIDHILTSGVRLSDVRVHSVEGADHRALTATLEPVQE